MRVVLVSLNFNLAFSSNKLIVGKGLIAKYWKVIFFHCSQCCNHRVSDHKMQFFYTNIFVKWWIDIWHLAHKPASTQQGSINSMKQMDLLYAYIRLRKHETDSVLQQCLLSPAEPTISCFPAKKRSLNEHSNHFVNHFNWKLMDWKDLVWSGLAWE